MKVVVILVILAVVGVVCFGFLRSSSESFDPTQQGLEARATVVIGSTWTDVLEATGEPRRWRNEPSGFDFSYVDRFEADTRRVIAEQLEKGDFPYGFSFLYRFSDAATFAVNFDRNGKVLNIQDKESQNDLETELGG